MKKSIKILSVILALAMVISMCGIFASAQSGPLNYVVLGDSIGWGAGVRNPQDACYGKIVANTNGYNFKNYAVNGYQTGNLINHLRKTEVANAVKDADIISISIGGNNYLQNNVVGLVFEAGMFQNVSRLDSIAAQIRADFAQIISMIKELNPDVLILAQTLYNPRHDLVRSTFQLGADRINACIRDYLSANPGAYEIVDVASALSSDISYIAADTIHPSAKGNVKIAELILKKLHDLGYSGKTEPVIVTKGIDQIPIPSFDDIIESFKNAYQSFVSFIGNAFGSLAF